MRAPRQKTAPLSARSVLTAPFQPTYVPHYRDRLQGTLPWPHRNRPSFLLPAGIYPLFGVSVSHLPVPTSWEFQTPVCTADRLAINRIHHTADQSVFIFRHYKAFGGRRQAGVRRSLLALQSVPKGRRWLQTPCWGGDMRALLGFSSTLCASQSSCRSEPGRRHGR